MTFRLFNGKQQRIKSVGASMRYWTGVLVAAAGLAVCSTASDAKFRLFGSQKPREQAQERIGPQPVPYHWTQGAAPRAHRDMVAEFGKVGLKPGQYVWAASTPTDGDTRIVVDLLTQMTYVYRDELFWGQDRLDFLDRALADSA